MGKLVVLWVLFCSASAFSLDLESHILFVGKTGAGKTTMINMIGHAIKNEAYNKPRNFLVPITSGRFSYRNSHAEGKIAPNDSTESQTESVAAFKVAAQHRSIVLTDTPGLLDTNERRRYLNDENMKTYLATHQVRTVALVISASDMRGTREVINVFNSFLELFPSAEAVIKNLVVLVTFTPQPDENMVQLVHNRLTGLDDSQFFFFDNSSLIVGPRTNLEIGQRAWDRNQNEMTKLLGQASLHAPLETKMFREHQQALSAIKTALAELSAMIFERNKLNCSHSELARQIIELKNTVKVTADHTVTKKVTSEQSAGTYQEQGSYHGFSRPTYTKCKKCGGQGHVCTISVEKDVTVVNDQMKTSHQTATAELDDRQAIMASVVQNIDQAHEKLEHQTKLLRNMSLEFIGKTGAARLNTGIVRAIVKDHLAKDEPIIANDPYFIDLKRDIGLVEQH